jgi:RNA polymerase sigma-70 factor (ECF subfamily)
MDNAIQGELTRLLGDWSNGDPTALEKLTPLVYGELRKLARFHMSREAPGHTLQPTGLINEAYMKLVELRQAEWKDRKHFFAAASQIMRHLLVDYARKKRSDKRGREAKRVPFEEAIAVSTETPVDILELDEVLDRLAAMDARKARIIELSFFGGLTVQEIANTLDISTSTVNRDLEFAKVWMAREIRSIDQ